MAPTSRQDAIRRLIGAAFDAGVTAASSRSPRRAEARQQQLDYADQIIASWIDTDVAQRLDAEKPA